MNTKNTFVLLLLFMMLCGIGKTQNTFQFGLLPAININKKLGGDIKLNFKSESRQIVYREEDAQFKSELIDFSMISSTKIGLSSSLAGGYLIRFRNNERIHRLIQQFAITNKYNFLRLAHRFSSDQTFEKEENTTFRFRYRISGQIPLSGQSVNPKEFYLKINHEYLNAFQGDTYDLEIRLLLNLGYEFNDNNKLEFGIENRSDSFIKDKVRHRSWLNLGWYVAL